MKINGDISRKIWIPISLSFGDGATYEFFIEPLPIGFEIKISSELQEPQPPTSGFLRENGKLLRDQEGSYIPEKNFHDKNYLVEKMKYDAIINIAICYRLLKSAKGIDLVFESKLENGNYEKFYEDIREELNNFGFTQQHLVQLMTSATNFSKNFSNDLEAEKKS